MNKVAYHNNSLYLEQISLADIAAKYSTPCYVYSKNTILDKFNAYKKALANQSHTLCYAVKANSNLAVLNLLAQQGSGFDVVSGGELARALAAGAEPKKIVFSGVGKNSAEIAQAIQAGIYSFNVESVAELERINDIALEIGTKAPVSCRVNPNIDAKTHPYISTGLTGHKFGIAHTDILAVYEQANQLPGLKIVGISYHIGSQLTEIAPFLEAAEFVLQLIDNLAQQGINIGTLNVGGGLGVQYTDEQVPNISEYAGALAQLLGNRKIKLIIEPGRSIVADAGVLLTKVEYLKPTSNKSFAIVDAAMNDLLRPCLYQATHKILPVRQSDNSSDTYDVVGPVCESSDVLAKDLHAELQQDDILAVLSAGAYGFSMSSNYNTRTRVAEVLIDGDKSYLVRQREKVQDLWQLESIPEY